jgi:hypothetical protein
MIVPTEWCTRCGTRLINEDERDDRLCCDCADVLAERWAERREFAHFHPADEPAPTPPCLYCSHGSKPTVRDGIPVHVSAEGEIRCTGAGNG